MTPGEIEAADWGAPPGRHRADAVPLPTPQLRRMTHR